MNKYEEIKRVALKKFSESGYEGVSLANISEEVGIKKQSIYNYFHGKDELFLQLCEETRITEISTMKEYLRKRDQVSFQKILVLFLQEMISHYKNDPSTKFLLRNSFLPPFHLKEQLIAESYLYLDQLEALLFPVFKKAKDGGEINEQIGEKIAINGFLGVLDSLLVELLYGDDHRLAQRFEALWIIFWNGIKTTNNESKGSYDE